MIPTAFGDIEIESLELGFNGVYKRDRWVPLRIVLTSQNEAFKGEIHVEVRNIFSGGLIQAYAIPLSLTRADRQRRFFYIFLPGISTKLNLALISEEGRMRLSQEIIPEPPRQAADLVTLALTRSRDLLSHWNGKQICEKEGGHFFVAYADFKHLPRHWKGYDSVDLFIFRDVLLTERRISKQQQQALLDWIQRGGTVLVSGGVNFHHLQGSFLEPFLPVDILGLRTATHLPKSMAQFGFEADSPFDLIEFRLKPGVQALVGDRNQIYVAKKSLGSGQIISLAFDYNVSPFSGPPGVGAFWRWLLSTQGKSPRHMEARYEAYRRHHEKILRLLTALPSTGAPILRLLAVYLIVYVMSLSGVTWWTRKRKPCAYWIGGTLTAVLFSCAVILLRNFVPSPVSINRFSVLSVYPERDRVHLQTYIGLIATADSKTPVQFQGGTFTRPLTPTATPPLQLVEAKNFQLRGASLDPWIARAYFAESFIDLPSPRSFRRAVLENRALPENDGEVHPTQIRHQLPGVLEKAWLIDGSKHKYIYLGSIPPDTDVEITENPETYQRFSFPEELSGIRKQFAQILIDEGVLRYVIQEEKPKVVGWSRESFLPIALNHPVNLADETFVILYLSD